MTEPIDTRTRFKARANRLSAAQQGVVKALEDAIKAGPCFCEIEGEELCAFCCGTAALKELKEAGA